jgi:uncharacterized RDD family membrane protein YckC
MLAGYAGFWKRVWAFLIDLIVLGAYYYLLIEVLGGLSHIEGSGGYLGSFFPFLVLIPILYYPFFESSRMRGTIGKRLCNIMVTDRNGNSISFWRSVIRNLAKILSTITFGIGFMMAGFTERKQALHDMIAECCVANRQDSKDLLAKV